MSNNRIWLTRQQVNWNECWKLNYLITYKKRRRFAFSDAFWVMYSMSFFENCFNNEKPILFCKEKSVINRVCPPFNICTSLFMPKPNSRLSTHKRSILTIPFFIFTYSLCNQFVIILYRHNTPPHENF